MLLVSLEEHSDIFVALEKQSSLSVSIFLVITS
jgi:hypothetical protein